MEWTGKALAAEKYNVHALQIFLELLGSLSPADTIAMLNGVYDKKGDAPFLLRNLGMEKHRQVRLYYLRQAGVATDDFEDYWLAGRTMAAAASLAEDMDALCRRVLCEAKASGRMPERMMLPSRIRHRVLAGGHDVPTPDVLRRYARSVENVKDYAALADVLYVFDASHLQQEMIYRRNGGERELDPRRAPLMRKALGL